MPLSKIAVFNKQSRLPISKHINIYYWLLRLNLKRVFIFVIFNFNYNFTYNEKTWYIGKIFVREALKNDRISILREFWNFDKENS